MSKISEKSAPPPAVPATSGGREGGSNYDLYMKILLIGNSNAGKNKLLLRFASDSTIPGPSLMSTLGIEFKTKVIVLDDLRIKLQIWDTAGQERFRTITTSYFRGTHGCLLVYDVSDRESFECMRYWHNQIRQHGEVNVQLVLVGNHGETTENREISTEEGQALANEFGIHFFEVSPEDNMNIERAFITLVGQIKNNLVVNGPPQQDDQRSSNSQCPVS